MFVQWNTFIRAELNPNECWCCSHNRQWTKTIEVFSSTQTLIPWLFGHHFRTITVGLPCDSADKIFACNVGDLGLIPGLGRFPGEGKGYPLQYSGLENSMDSRVHGVTNSWTRLSDFHFHRTVCAFAFNCYPIRWKALDAQSFIPHTVALKSSPS